MAEQPLAQDEAQMGMAEPSYGPCLVIDSVCRKVHHSFLSLPQINSLKTAPLTEAAPTKIS